MNPDNPSFRTDAEERRAKEYALMTKQNERFNEAIYDIMQSLGNLPANCTNVNLLTERIRWCLNRANGVFLETRPATHAATVEEK